MRILRFASAAAAVLLCLSASMTAFAQSAAPLPAQDAMSLKASRADDGSIVLSWTVAPGVYLYRDKIAAKSGSQPAAVDTPPGKVKDDPTFGSVEIYDADFVGKVDGRGVEPTKPLEVTYQGCDESGVCYPPITQEIDLARIAQPGGKVAAKEKAGDADLQDHVADEKTSETASGPSDAASSPPVALAPDLDGSFAFVLVTFFGLGLLLALTPCVYPMIPILVGVLARSGETLSPRRGLALSASYVFAMAAAYGALGVAAAWSGQNLQIALQTPAALTLSSLVFVVLALSMFGIFQLQAPAAIASRFSGLTSRARGSALGAASLGFVSALIVGPCVTPPLAAALVYVAQTGDVVRGSSALFMMGLGMGAPLVAVGVFGARILPKSGRWLEMVKHGFGVVFLAIAIMLIGRIAPPAATLALWALFAIGLGVFLGAFDATGRRSGAAGRLSKAAGVAAVVYGAALIVGVASGGDNALRPLSRIVAAAPAAPPSGSPETTVASAEALDAALTAARKAGRPSLVAFTADWCSICAENEKTIGGSQKLQTRLQDFSVIKVDVTQNDAKSRTIMSKLRIFGPPTALFYDRKGAELTALRSSGAVDVADFDRRLTQAGGA